MNRLVITDSGLGGLNVVAMLYEKIKNLRFDTPFDLIFVNALPESGKGYNKMPDITSKVRVFNNVLTGIETKFNPDLIGIACNTLSVIADQTDFFKQNSDRILGIVERGIKSFLRKINNKQHFYTIVFGTETTIEMDSHRRLLVKSGISNDFIIPQICSGLASAIENDPEGPETRQIIGESVKKALNKCEKSETPLYAYLACTHYGYVKQIFEKSIKKEGFANCQAFDPNQSMVENLYTFLKLPSPETYATESMVRINIYSRCTILDNEIESITHLLSKYSPQTATVLTEYKKVPDLF